jgi:hypothetical protein
MTAILPPPISLGQRRGITLSTQIPPSPYESSAGASSTLTNLPRRKRPGKKLWTPVKKEIVLIREEKRERDRCWSEVVTDIFVAFHGEEEEKVSIVEGGKKYTHIITVSLAHGAGVQEKRTDLPDGSCVQALHLSVRLHEDDPARAQRVGLGLSSEQLKATSIFLSNAFCSTSTSSSSNPRVLITCPYGRQTDAMSIIATYLSRSLEEDVVDILKVIDLIDGLRSVWKGEVSENEVAVIRSVLSENGWMAKS